MKFYFAYGSNMNPERVRARGLAVVAQRGARLPDYRLTFDKMSRDHAVHLPQLRLVVVGGEAMRSRDLSWRRNGSSGQAHGCPV